MAEPVEWEKRAEYMRQTHKLIRALSRSLDCAQEGKHLDLELDELIEVQQRAMTSYDQAVEAAARG